MRIIKRIEPFGRLIFLAIWISLLFAIATNIQAGWLYVVISFLIILGIASAAISVRSLHGIKVGISLPELCGRGEPATAVVTIENPGRFSRQMIRVELPNSDQNGVAFDPPNLLATSIPARSSVRMNARFVPARRGPARIESATVSCSGPTGLYTKRRGFRAFASTLVYPKIIRSDGEALAAEASQESSPLNRRLIMEDPYHYSLREYVPGDSLRRIHWKLTAKRNEPIVRVNESKTFGLSGIYIDNIRSRYHSEEDFEKLLEQAASLARHLLFERGMSVTLSAAAAPELTVETHEMWENALRWFALIRLEETAAEKNGETGISENAEFVFGPGADTAPVA